MKKEFAGFTLIEVLVAMGIMILIMGVVVSSISSARQSSRDGKRVADINLIRLALEQYYDACGQYPNVSPLTTSVSVGCIGSTNLGNFLAEIPKDPSTGADYQYFASGSGTNCTRYHVGALLENASHRALSEDGDVASGAIGSACTGGGTDFSGTSAGSGGLCGTDTGGTERCYDGIQSK